MDRMKKKILALRPIVFVVLLLCAFAAKLIAGEPIVWEMSSRAELLKGEAHGISVTDNGVLTLAPL